MHEVEAWLTELGLPQYAEAFRRNHVDETVLSGLTDEDLRSLGVDSLGHRKRIIAAIAARTQSVPKSGLPGTAEEGTAAPGGIPTQAERRQLSVMFCDLVGSTELSQRLDPEELRQLIREYQKVCLGAIKRYEGHVAQFLGDGVLAYFGYPVALESSPESAVRAGLAVLEGVQEYSRGSPQAMRVRIGIDTGLVVIGQGNDLSEQDRTAIGDAPNLAARLQGLAQPGTIVVSNRTRQLAAGSFEYLDLGTHSLKGVSEPIHAWQIGGEKSSPTRFDASAGPELAPMIGRAAEFDATIQAWRRVKAGKLHMVLLSGEPGIGKSRLFRAVRETLAEEGMPIWQYQCSPYFVNSMLHPVVESLQRAMRWTREDSASTKLDKLEALLDSFGRPRSDANLIARLLNLPADERYPALAMVPQRHKEETIQALCGIVDAAARSQPLLLLFEDLHWADPTTLELIDALLARSDASPVMLVATHRPEFQPRWLGREGVTALSLSRLGAQETEQIATQTAGKRLPEEVMAQIVAKTDGIPLFVEELTKTLLESRFVKDAGTSFELADPILEVAVPSTLHDSLMARLDKLTPEKQIAQIGACIGRNFAYELTALVAPLSRPQLDQALDRLVAAGLVFRRGTAAEPSYVFKHALIQDAAYASLLKSNRIQIHEKIAGVLEQRFAEIRDAQPELLAHHYTAAQRYSEAIGYWQKAGELAMHRVAIREAIAHAERGVELIGLLPASPALESLELDLHAALGIAWMIEAGWAHPKVHQNMEQAWTLTQRLDRGDHTLRILYGLWAYRHCVGEVKLAREVAEQLLAEAKRTGRPDLELVGHVAAGFSAHYCGDFDQALVHAEAIFERHDVARDRHIVELLAAEPKSIAYVIKAATEWYLGYPERALRTTEAAVASAREVGHPVNLAYTILYSAYIHFNRHDAVRCALALNEVAALGREHALPFYEHICVPISMPLVYLLEGRVEEAETGFQAPIAMWTGIGLHVGLTVFRSAQAEAAMKAGHVDHALSLLDEVLDQTRRPGWEEQYHLAQALTLRGKALDAKGEVIPAEATYLEALKVARQQRAKSWELSAATAYARLMASQHRLQQARELLQPIYDWFTEGFDTRDLIEAKALLDELVAEAA